MGEKTAYRIYLYISIFLVILGFLVIEALRPHFFLQDDILNQFLPQILLGEKTLLKDGAVPLVNYYQFLGNPLFGQGQYGILYPLRIVAYLSGSLTGAPVWIPEIEIAIHILIAVIFSFLFLKSYKIKPGLCCLGAIIYCYNGFFMVAGKSWLHVSMNYAFIPLQLFLVRQFLVTGRISSVVILGIVRGLSFYNGYAQLFVYTSIFECAFFLLSPERARKKGECWLFYLLSFAMTLVIGSVLMLSMLEAFIKSSRKELQNFFIHYFRFPARPLELLAGGIIPWPFLKSKEIFGFTEGRFITMYYNPFAFFLVYSCLIVMAFFGKVRERISSLPRWGIIAGFIIIACTALIFSNESLYFRMINALYFYALPLLSANKYVYYLFTLRFNVLCGIGSTILLIWYSWWLFKNARGQSAESRERHVMAWLFLLSLNLAFGIYSPLFHLFYKLPVWKNFRWSFKFLLYVHFFATVLGILLLQSITEKLKPRLIARYQSIFKHFLPMGLLILWMANLVYMTEVSSTSFLGDEQNIQKKFSLPALDTALFRYSRVVPVRQKHLDLIEGQNANFSSFYETYNWAGYDIIIDEAKQAMVGLNMLSSIENDEFFLLRKEYLRLFGVRWYLCPREEAESLRFLTGADFIRHEWGPRFFAFEDTKACPVVYLQGDGRALGFATRGNQIVVDIPEGTGGNDVLIVAFYYSAGNFRAFVDGSPVQVTHDPYMRLCIPVSSGCKRVEIEYYSRFFTMGLIVCVTGVPAVSLIMLFFAAKTRGKSECTTVADACSGNKP